MSVGKTAAGAGVWAWNEFGKGFIDSTTKLLKRKFKDKKEQSKMLRDLELRWQDFSWGNAAERYKTHMQEIYGYRLLQVSSICPLGRT